MKKLTLILFSIFTVVLQAKQVFKGADGLVVMEAESTTSSKGKWKKKKSVTGFTGDCHLEFTGNKPMNGEPKSPLKYDFTVDKDGIYELHIRAHKRLDGARHDLCNDCYVKLKGKYKSGGKAPKKILLAKTKLFGGDHRKWGWTHQLDVNHKKYKPLYELKAGEKYLLTVYGRSQRFNIDRIIFRHQSVKINKVKDPKLPESKK